VKKRLAAAFLLGAVAGGLGVWGFFAWSARKYVTPAVCYECFWKAQPPALRKDLVDFYQQYRNPDPFVMADVGFILWRATEKKNCDAVEQYRALAHGEADPNRRYLARAIAAFSAPECGDLSPAEYARAAEAARQLGLKGEADVLERLSERALQPKFEEIQIETALRVPPGAKTMVLGESRIELAPGTKVGAQVDRVARDWLSYQMKWDLSAAPMNNANLLTWHEGALLRRVADAAPVDIYPLSGTLVAKRGNVWYAPDDTGAFRFEVLDDKVEYPTSHVAGRFGVLEDTHGISALVSQAVNRGVQVVVGCGDSDGKAKAAYYLAQRGVNVIMPGDRFLGELVGYQGKGVLLGTAPVRQEGNKAVVGGQPVRFALGETIVVQDTKLRYRVQYYDAGARYFRALAKWAPLKLEFVEVSEQNQLDRVLARAGALGATAVGVRVMTQKEHDLLAAWLKQAPERRAVLFHSGLYPFAQPLFQEFPRQVTFGDPRPRFE